MTDAEAMKRVDDFLAMVRLTIYERMETHGSPERVIDDTGIVYGETTPWEVCMFNIAQKVSRGRRKVNLDHAIDIAGYAALASLWVPDKEY